MRTKLLIGLITLLAVCCKAQTESPEIVKVGEMMPAFTIISDDGSRFSSDALKGKVVFINFFATWCPPCQKELPEVESQLWAKYKGNKDFQLLVIGREHTDAELSKYNGTKGFTFPLYPDRERVIFDAFAKSLIPRSYLIGKDGKVLHVLVGYTEEEFQDVLKRIEEALKN